MYYFSYGSNMSIQRLQQRIASAVKVAVGCLRQHQLAFHKVSIDGSSKCDAVYTGNRNDKLFGVIFDIDDSQQTDLDQYEGLGVGYARKPVRIKCLDAGFIDAFTYYAIATDPILRPYHWYKTHVITGARENQLPSAYIQAITSVESIQDPNNERHKRESALYRVAPIDNDQLG